MSDELYESKALAKRAVESALDNYREAAEAFGSTTSEMADEISDCLSDAMMGDIIAVVE